MCPAETSQLITRPEAIQAISPDVPIDGECVENSSTQSGSVPLLSCNDEGQWTILIPCHCNPGYELVDGQQQCSGTLYMYMYMYMYYLHIHFVHCHTCTFVLLICHPN